MQDDFVTVKEENRRKRDAILQFLLSRIVSVYCGAQQHFLLYERSSMSDVERRLQPLHGTVEVFSGGRVLDFLRVPCVSALYFLKVLHYNTDNTADRAYKRRDKWKENVQSFMNSKDS